MELEMRITFAYLFCLIVAASSYVFCIYTQVWYLDDATTLKIHLAFIVPMTAAVVSILLRPSYSLVGGLAALAFASPYYFSPFAPTLPIICIEAILVVALITATAFVRRSQRALRRR